VNRLDDCTLLNVSIERFEESPVCLQKRFRNAAVIPIFTPFRGDDFASLCHEIKGIGELDFIACGNVLIHKIFDSFPERSLA
jgi:hypothetical protein